MRAKMTLDDLKNMWDLTGKVAVVTGGSGGAGKAISLGLALYGADVVVTARTLSSLESTAAEVRKLGKKALPISCDVSDPKSVENMGKKVIDEFGKIDIMVTAAGIALRTEAENMQIENFKKVMAANVEGTLLCAQVAAKDMIKRGQGETSSRSGRSAGFRAIRRGTPPTPAARGRSTR